MLAIRGSPARCGDTKGKLGEQGESRVVVGAFPARYHRLFASNVLSIQKTCLWLRPQLHPVCTRLLGGVSNEFKEEIGVAGS